MRPRVGVSQDRGRDEGLGLAPALSRAFGSVIWVAFVSYSLLPLLATVLFSVSEGWVNTVFPERLSVASYAALSAMGNLVTARSGGVCFDRR